jgi:hypothetical protein
MSEQLWAAIGWLGTIIFCASFLIKSRRWLHAVGLVGAIIKLVYTWHYQLWPLAANWVILIFIEAWATIKNKE